jgi:Zn-finger protein
MKMIDAFIEGINNFLKEIQENKGKKVKDLQEETNISLKEIQENIIKPVKELGKTVQHLKMKKETIKKSQIQATIEIEKL